jgi:hypothetical protein
MKLGENMKRFYRIARDEKLHFLRVLKLFYVPMKKFFFISEEMHSFIYS